MFVILTNAQKEIIRKIIYAVETGSLSAVKRMIAKTKKPYTLDNLYSACLNRYRKSSWCI